MILDIILRIASIPLTLIMLIFPSSDGLPDGVSSAFSYIGGYFGILDPIVPIDTFFTVLGLVITMQLAVFAFRALRWLFSLMPLGIGGYGN